jgi:hypothetical protein
LPASADSILRLATWVNKGKKSKSRALTVWARFPQDPASEHEANLLLPILDYPSFACHAALHGAV